MGSWPQEIQKQCAGDPPVWEVGLEPTRPSQGTGFRCEQEQQDYQDEEQVAQEVGHASQNVAVCAGQSAGFHRVAKIDV